MAIISWRAKVLKHPGSLVTQAPMPVMGIQPGICHGFWDFEALHRSKSSQLVSPKVFCQ